MQILGYKTCLIMSWLRHSGSNSQMLLTTWSTCLCLGSQGRFQLIFLLIFLISALTSTIFRYDEVLSALQLLLWLHFSVSCLWTEELNCFIWSQSVQICRVDRETQCLRHHLETGIQPTDDDGYWSLWRMSGLSWSHLNTSDTNCTKQKMLQVQILSLWNDTTWRRKLSYNKWAAELFLRLFRETHFNSNSRRKEIDKEQQTPWGCVENTSLYTKREQFS